MTLEERVLAIKAKFEEATDELLDLASEGPDRFSEAMKLVGAPSVRAPQVSGHSELVTRLWVDGEEQPVERLPLPWTGRFLEIGRREIRHEREPVDVLIPAGEVFVLVNVWPENQARTRAFRELNAGALTPEEYGRLQAEIDEAEAAVGKV